jgi:uncharacterized protein YodC (DUF2158 family)
MAKFNPRDVVQLNSGGPLMTVWKASTTIKDGATCCWFTTGHEFREHDFPESLLTPAAAPTPPGPSAAPAPP